MSWWETCPRALFGSHVSKALWNIWFYLFVHNRWYNINAKHFLQSVSIFCRSIWVICRLSWEQRASLFVLGGCGAFISAFWTPPSSTSWYSPAFYQIWDELSSHVLIARAFWRVFTNTEHSGTVIIAPCGDYSAERSINDRHLHSALQPELELGRRLWDGEKKKMSDMEREREGKSGRERQRNKLTLNKAAEVFTVSSLSDMRATGALRWENGECALKVTDFSPHAGWKKGEKNLIGGLSE